MKLKIFFRKVLFSYKKKLYAVVLPYSVRNQELSQLYTIANFYVRKILQKQSMKQGAVF